eukprot:3115023-Prymnesium_polylepis.1
MGRPHHCSRAGRTNAPPDRARERRAAIGAPAGPVGDGLMRLGDGILWGGAHAAMRCGHRAGALAHHRGSLHMPSCAQQLALHVTQGTSQNKIVKPANY